MIDRYVQHKTENARAIWLASSMICGGLGSFYGFGSGIVQSNNILVIIFHFGKWCIWHRNTNNRSVYSVTNYTLPPNRIKTLDSGSILFLFFMKNIVCANLKSL